MDTVGKKFIHDIADIYDAEHRFLEAQEELFGRASSSLLMDLIGEHIAQTRQHIQHIDAIYAIMGTTPQRGNCATAAGLVVEGDAMVREVGEMGALLDSVIATALGKAEHYEIASYRNLIITAEYFSQPKMVELLRRNLAQEEQTAQKMEECYRSLLQYVVSSQRLQAALGESRPIF